LRANCIVFPGSAYAAKLFHRIASFSKRKVLVCVLAAVLPMAIRLAALGYLPMPYPYVHDEFAYLLGADTFAAGRLTNPSPPLWIHFETFHENLRPTYALKYPPGQSLFLAFGQKFLGHPWYGVWISFGVMCACLCWMLQGWAPPVYALLGTLVGIAELGVFGYWMNSYWGGALTAAGGSLVLGALPRLARRPRLSAAVLGSLGLVILLNTRPYEGGVLSLAAGAALVWWRRRRTAKSPLLVPRILIPFVLICASGAAWTGYYNYRVTGNPLLLPYVLNERTYAATPIFYLEPHGKTPIYHHEMLRQAWVDWNGGLYYKLRANPLRALMAFYDILPFYTPALFFFAAAAGLLFFRRSLKMRVVIGLLAAIWLALLMEKMWLPHYFAPAAGLLVVAIVYSIRWIRIQFRASGTALALLFVACCFGYGLAKAVNARATRVIPPQEQATRKVEALSKPGERLLVIVRYAPGHSSHVEYVFNRADIDHSQIVWARDMGEEKNKELLDYYPHRRVWLLEPDQAPMSLTRYAK
jgi:hypothetical protein